MRGVKSLLVLVMVLAGLGTYIYFVESKKPQGEEATLSPKVFTVKTDAIDEITVKSASGDKTTLKKVGYTGIVGLQGYGVGGPSEAHLGRSMGKWKEIMKAIGE